ncbi:MAG: hypothetical protein ACYS8I_06505 [Planctomycetota bacterium]
MNLKESRAAKVFHFFILALVSGFILSIFVRPTGHAGINSFERSVLQDMVDGTAYRPYVYRVLVPSTLRAISSITPASIEDSFSAIAETNPFLAEAFNHLGWNASSAYLFFWLTIIMLLSFIGFAHNTSRLSIKLCDMPDTGLTRVSLAVIALLGLPPFFKFVSFIYDPTQLFLFTLALWYVANSKTRAFLVTFGFCCLNKETSILLIPIYAVSFLRNGRLSKQYLGVLLGITSYYLIVRSSITYIFLSNPGPLATFHLTDHNLKWLTNGWNFSDLLVILSLITLLTYKWKKKPVFLKDSFICTFVPLFGLCLVLGFIDEWRAYYEAYALGFGLILDSILRLKRALDIQPHSS